MFVNICKYSVLFYMGVLEKITYISPVDYYFYNLKMAYNFYYNNIITTDFFAYNSVLHVFLFVYGPFDFGFSY